MSKMAMPNILNGRWWRYDQETEDFLLGETEAQTPRLTLVIGVEELRPLYVIAECYDHAREGRVKVKYHAEFTRQERSVISSWYLRLYAYSMVSGVPRVGVSIRVETYHLLRRAANFFATV